MSIRRFSVLTGIPYRYVSSDVDNRWDDHDARRRSLTGGSSIDEMPLAKENINTQRLEEIEEEEPTGAMAAFAISISAALAAAYVIHRRIR